jgi:FHS family L-fucose permease-like MFS transporter
MVIAAARPSEGEANATTLDASEGGLDAPDLRYFVMALFFIFGGITSLNDIVAPKLKELFTLNDFQMNLVNLAFFISYGLVSIPAAALVRRIGYMKGATAGLVIMALGCFLFIPASKSGLFGVFLLAVFGLGAGITLVQVVANPLISLLGPRRTVHSRLTFAQAFNSLGTTIFPPIGAAIILGSLANMDPSKLTGDALTAYRTAESQVVVTTYLGFAIAILVVAAVVWTRRNRLPAKPPAGGSILRAFDLLGQRRFGWGAACIFLYVGAEVAIGTILVNYLGQANVWGMQPRDAGKHVIYYWGGAMGGRFIGSYVLRLVSPGLVLAAVASGAISLILISANTTGVIAGWSILSIGLMNSIMFPTIFSLACEGVEERREEASGIICVAIVGGAIIPPLFGHLADVTTRQFALILPALCYATIASFGLFARRPASAAKGIPATT